MIGALHPDPGPGLIARELPRAAVTVRDPAGLHHFFKSDRRGIRFGANFCNGIVWSVCVSIDGRDYVVPPTFVRDAAGDAVSFDVPSALIIPFPPRGAR
jgi:hypothetical protein